MEVKEDRPMNVYAKLMYVQQNLKAPKGQYNSFGDYHYRSCEDIQEALKPLLDQTKTVLLLNDEIIQIGDRFYIKAVATFQDTESTEFVSNCAYARESESRSKMDAAQITGSCSSYARKYALNGLFCIDDAKDPDASVQVPDTGRRNQGTGGDRPRPAAGSSQRGNPPVGNLPISHINTIRKQIERTGAKEKAVCYQYRISKLEDMTIEQFKDAMEIFRNMPDKVQKMPEEVYQTTLAGIEDYNDEMPFR